MTHPHYNIISESYSDPFNGLEEEDSDIMIKLDPTNSNNTITPTNAHAEADLPTTHPHICLCIRPHQ